MALNLDTIGKKIGPVTKDYAWKDVVLYALGVGAGFDELECEGQHPLEVLGIHNVQDHVVLLLHKHTPGYPFLLSDWEEGIHARRVHN